MHQDASGSHRKHLAESLRVFRTGLDDRDLGSVLDVPLTIHMSYVSSFYIC